MADQDTPTFMSGLMAGLNQAPSNPLVNLGLGLMSAAKPYGNVGDALMQANQQTIQNRGAMQQQGIQSYQLARQKELWPAYKAIADQVAGRFGSGNMTNPAPSQAPGVPSQAPNRYDPLPPLSPISSNPGGDVQLNSAAKFLGMPAPAPEAKDVQTALEVQQKQRQQSIAPQLADLDTIMTSADADKRLQKDSHLNALWQNEQTGQPLTPPAARAFAGTVYNRLAGSAQSPVKPIPEMLQNVSRGVGGVAQVDPVNGKLTPGVGELETAQFTKPDGSVVVMPKAQGIAQGLQPYESALYGLSTLKPEAKESAYQTYLKTGSLPSNMSRNPAMQGTMLSYVTQRYNQEHPGGNAGAFAASASQSYKAQQDVVDDFTSGATAKNINGLNTSVQHLTYLQPLIGALQSGNLTALNKASNAYKENTGSTAPTNFAALKEFVGGEVARAVLPGGGGEAERQSLTDPLNAANSPKQLKEAVSTIQQALAGKTLALKNQWDVGTQGSQGSFDKFLLPETKKALSQEGGKSAHPANIQALIDKYTKKPNAGSQ